ncbi:radical SAM protein [Parabacteroides sp. PF5-9]|uniref:radical SAM/SPASM domain-containing protein n=1 Tax=Parabacteroides sp. PF5-9 TaxID=1742404 RepID=UPI002473E288|nr:radical SAM protein [Parabacteroides sp. PF5-9]MDH6356404.1 uncharacterized protein [Parabacteroides sp. PF5-9]
MNTPTFMIVPSMACQASCNYCFGPHKGAVMDEDTVRETIRFIQEIAEETAARNLSIIFHGGEPLLAPLAIWELFFDEIKENLSGYRLKMNIQSNLWNLNETHLKLFRDNHVTIGTSLDGPKELCDINRGEGYFDKTSASIKKANTAGCMVSAIATITRQTYHRTEEIVKFFRNNGMSLVLHGAVAGMDRRDTPFSLSSEEYAQMIKDLFPWYVKNRKHIQIETLDHFVRGIVWGESGVCTFRDCFGMFFSISPTGDITSCQRLTGKKEFCLGNIFDRPSLATLYDSDAARKQKAREKQTIEKCADCETYSICKGGCYYTALASGDGVIDPLCEAYKAIYDYVQNQIVEEMQSAENKEAISSRQYEADEHPLLRKGDFISLSHKTHPVRVADNARRVLALYELGKTNDPVIAAQKLYDQKICGDTYTTSKILANLYDSMCRNRYAKGNCYVHITFDCNLRCSHCYADAGNSREEMPLAQFEQLITEAIEARFHKVVITGGEPLLYTQREMLLAICKKHRNKGVKLTLRTNFTGDFSEDDFSSFAQAFDEIVVSIDGNEQTHDIRRGKGSYQNMRRHLQEYIRVSKTMPSCAELSLACVMSAAEINGEPGESVSVLAQNLSIEKVRFRPVLPIGRASKLEEPVMCEGLMQHLSPEEMLKTPCNALLSCGIGQNIFIRPDGRSYPCYAWCGEHSYIGNVFEKGLNTVLTSPQFTRLTACTVETIIKCKDCDYRYLCGGACRAWGNQQENDLNAAPVQCTHLQEKAEKLIQAAKTYLIP